MNRGIVKDELQRPRYQGDRRFDPEPHEVVGGDVADVFSMKGNQARAERRVDSDLDGGAAGLHVRSLAGDRDVRHGRPAHRVIFAGVYRGVNGQDVPGFRTAVPAVEIPRRHAEQVLRPRHLAELIEAHNRPGQRQVRSEELVAVTLLDHAFLNRDVRATRHIQRR